MFANYELQDDLHDIAALGGSRIGLLPQTKEGDLQETVVRTAKEHNIDLEPGQVTVRRLSTDVPPVALEVHYRVRVDLLGYSFYMYFAPSSQSRSFWSIEFGRVFRRGGHA